MTQVEFIKAFNRFSIEEKVQIARKIQLQIADVLFEDLDADLPDVGISTAEIQEEIKDFRNEQKSKN
jgi:hypothetical protein